MRLGVNIWVHADRYGSNFFGHLCALLNADQLAVTLDVKTADPDFKCQVDLSCGFADAGKYDVFGVATNRKNPA